MSACVEEVDIRLSNQLWLQDQMVSHQDHQIDMSSLQMDMMSSRTDMILSAGQMMLPNIDMVLSSIDMMLSVDVDMDAMNPDPSDMTIQIDMMPVIEVGNLQINELNLITEAEPFIEIYNPLLYEFAFDDFSVEFYQIQFDSDHDWISDPEFLGHVNRCGYQQDAAYYACALSDIQNQLDVTNQDQMNNGIFVVMIVLLSYQNLVVDGLLISNSESVNEQVYRALYDDIYSYFPTIRLIDGFDFQLTSDLDDQYDKDYSISRCSQRQDHWDFFKLAFASMNMENLCSSP
jgi:hypothetical protein